jgi:hypothetical protein
MLHNFCLLVRKGRHLSDCFVVENANFPEADLRDKSMKTALDVYKKQITPRAFKEGMKLLEAAARSGK